MIKVRYKGYEPPEAVLTRISGIRLIVDTHYVDLRDTLVVVYRRGVGEKVSRHEIRLGGLNIEKIRGYLSERGLLDNNVINRVVEKYNTVIGYNIEDARKFDFLEKGLYGEWRIVEYDAERVTGIKSKPRDELGKHIVEVDVMETDRLVDAKFWDERTFKITFIYKDRRFIDSINRMVKYKKAMEIYHKNKVCVVFIDKINDKLFEEGKHNILEELTSKVGNTSWIEIVNGLNDRGKFYSNITKKVQES